MKKTIKTLAILAFMAGTISTSYGQEPDKKSEKARENLKNEQKDVVDAKKDLKKAQADSVSEYLKFRKESELKIKDNDQSIADLKVKHAKMNQKDNAAYQKKVSAFEVKNNNLRKKLNDYKDDKNESKWTSFKTEFNHDMNELGTALKDFTVNNKK